MAQIRAPEWIPRTRLLQGILPIDTAEVPGEILAGVTFAALAIPEVMGYTNIAGMPVVTGLYTILLPMAVFAIFGSSRHLVIGADSATAAVIASGLVVIAAPRSAQYVAYAGMIAIIAAAFLLLAGLLKLGFVSDFLSLPVIMGFLTGVGIQIALGQLGGMVGMASTPGGPVMQLVRFLGNLPSASLPTIALSLSVIGVIAIARRVSSRVPGALIAVIGTILFSWAFGLSSYGIAVLGTVPGGIPGIGLPAVPPSDVPGLIYIAAACFVIILAQSATTSRAYAWKFSETVDENIDLAGLGLANIAAGISGTFVVNGSPTKTEMVYAAGGRTQLTQLAAAAVVLAVLLLMTGPLAYLPAAVLSAVVFLIGLRLVDVEGLASLRVRRPVEFAVALVTAATVILIGIGQGIAIAVAASIIAHLRHSYRPLNSLLVPSPEGAIRTVPVAEGKQALEGLLMYRFGADLYFANERHFIDEIISLAKSADPPLRWFCISAENIGDVDYSGAETLKKVHGELGRRGIVLVMSDVEKPVLARIERDGIVELIGREYIFDTAYDVIRIYRDREARPGT
ncbi:MAG TPA: SulP family inorganic anion transporter [Methanomicrobiales archaeon]|nr:SulP family inorganic anion transporter [Methanomicrobiales archaeon]